jgi:hypothetical protein
MGKASHTQRRKTSRRRGSGSAGPLASPPWGGAAKPQRGGQLNLTYSKSTGWRLMPITGGAIQLAKRPGSTTRPISDAT